MTKKIAMLTALSVIVLGCSEPGPPEAECRAYSSQTALLLGRIDTVTGAHGRWLDQLAAAEPSEPRAHGAESVFRESCQRLGRDFDEAASELRRAASGSSLEPASDRAVRAAQGLSSTCVDLLQGTGEVGDDRQTREASLRSAMDELRQATEAARAACGASE